MSKEKIEEMACDICPITHLCRGEYKPTKSCYAFRCAEVGYENGYRKQEWISVDERLPEKNVRVLVYIKSSRSYTRFDTDRLDDRGFVRWFNDVTHWMPLPEPPKMKGGEG